MYNNALGGRSVCGPPKKVCKPVENDGPYSEAGGHDDDANANVVHFPRDWFGPREELVPFGPGAEDELPNGRETAAPVEIVAPPPARAEDFWGETSASIHDAMQAPVAPAPVPAGEEVAAGEPGAARGPGATAKQVAARNPVAWLRERPARRAARRYWPAGVLVARRRAVLWVGIGAVALGFVVVALASLQPPRVRATDGGVALLSPAAIGAVPPAIASRGTPSRTGRTRGTHRRVAGRSHTHPSRARASAARASAGSTTSTQAATVTPEPSTSSGPSSVPAQGTGSTSSTEASSGTSGGGASSAPAGPVGAGAPFGPGHLG